MDEHDEEDVEIYFIPFDDEHGRCIDMWTDDGWHHRVYLVEENEYGNKIKTQISPVDNE